MLVERKKKGVGGYVQKAERKSRQSSSSKSVISLQINKEINQRKIPERFLVAPNG